PYAMLLYAATGREKSVDDDRTFSVETGAVQCHTKRFGSGENRDRLSVYPPRIRRRTNQCGTYGRQKQENRF
ncbi:hypothetical protein NE599_20525, partial [[Clostridium] symbiosum]|uniref:hypothetical protein n=1 Tax=Clostridium symbiosum TaxID=1512 RepID=UPI00210B2493